MQDFFVVCIYRDETGQVISVGANLDLDNKVN